MSSGELDRAWYGCQTRARGLLDRESLRRHFHHLAPWYAHRLGPLLPDSPDAAWLDIPCGYGNFLYFLRQRGYRNVRGYDADPEQVRLARMLDLPAFEADALAVLNESTSEVDAIASLDFLEHLSKGRALRVLKLFHERLQPGGMLFLRTPCADGPFGARDLCNDLTHRWAPTSNLLRSMLQMSGFDDVRILDERPQPYRVRNRVRLAVFHLARCLAAGFVLALGITPPEVWTTSMWAVARRPLSVA